MQIQKITETLPAATVTQTTEIHITETVLPVTSTSIMTQSITLDPSTLVETSVQKITETLPPVTVTQTSEILITGTPVTITSTSIVTETVSVDPSTNAIKTSSIEVFCTFL